MSKAFVMVYYIVPQDNDDPEEPNAFGMPQAIENLRVSHIRENFPL